MIKYTVCKVACMCTGIIFQMFIHLFVFLAIYLWWRICAISYYRVFGAKRRTGATRKPAKWWLFRVFAWRPFAPPHEGTRHSMRCVFGYCFSYLCLAGRKVAMQKPAKSPFGGLSRGDLLRFRPENTLIRHGTNQQP